jgi:hypothetical protein
VYVPEACLEQERSAGEEPTARRWGISGEDVKNPFFTPEIETLFCRVCPLAASGALFPPIPEAVF